MPRPASSITPTTWKRTASSARWPGGPGKTRRTSGMTSASDRSKLPTTMKRRGRLALQLNRRERIVRSGRREEGSTRCARPGSARRSGKGETRQTFARGAQSGISTGTALDKYKKDEEDRKGGKNEKPLLQPSVDMDLRDRRKPSRTKSRGASPQAHRAGGHEPGQGDRARRDPGRVHQPRTDEGQLRFLADPGQGRADARVPGRAESHPRRRPGLRQRRHDPRPAEV